MLIKKWVTFYLQSLNEIIQTTIAWHSVVWTWIARRHLLSRLRFLLILSDSTKWQVGDNMYVNICTTLSSLSNSLECERLLPISDCFCRLKTRSKIPLSLSRYVKIECQFTLKVWCFVQIQIKSKLNKFRSTATSPSTSLDLVAVYFSGQNTLPLGAGIPY